MRIRTGRKQPRNLYLQSGPTPSDADVLCGQVDTPELARLIVAAVEVAEANSAGEAAYITDPHGDHDALVLAAEAASRHYRAARAWATQ